MALCFAQEILTGSISIAITALIFNVNTQLTFVKVFCKLDSVTANLKSVEPRRSGYPTKGVYNHLTILRPLGCESSDMLCNAFWSDTVPRLFVHPYSLVIFRK
jgi:hypothetical protein